MKTRMIQLLAIIVLIVSSCDNAVSNDPADNNVPTIYKKYIIAKIGDASGAGIKGDGSLWTWGDNNLGPLGNNTNASFTSNEPIKIGTDLDWKTLDVGQAHVIALKNNGTLWGWGNNNFGQLGIGTTTNVGVRVPTQIGTATDWKEISSKFNHTLAIKTDGTLWAWGRNDYTGTLGDGTTTNKLSPVQIGTATDWKSVSAGDHHSMAIKNYGSLWAWGNNDEGQFGRGNTIGSLVPINVSATVTGNNPVYIKVSCGAFHTLAIRSDYSMWSVGANQFGQLGDGTNSSKTNFVNISNNRGWGSISAGLTHNVAVSSGSSSEGPLYTWGSNNKGQLGDGTLVNKNVPTLIFATVNLWQVGLATAGYNRTIGRYQDGTETYSWGDNVGGQLGVSDNVNYNVPRRITK